MALIVFAVVALFVITGCQTPDLKPFADSTAALNTAVREGQKVFVRELEAIKAADKEAAYVDGALTSFTNHWQLRVAFMDSVVEYTEQLAAVADAPRQRAENTAAMADALKKVADNFGPYGAAVTGTLDIVRKVDQLAAQARVARTLAQAIEKANPVITNVVSLLCQDFAAMEGALRVERKGLPGLLRRPYDDALEARKMLLAQMPELYTRLLQQGNSSGWGPAAGNFNRDVAEGAKALAQMDSWYLPLKAQLKESDERIAAGVALLSGARNGVLKWGEIHGKLIEDLAHHRQPNWRLLLETAREIQNDIERIRKHEAS